MLKHLQITDHLSFGRRIEGQSADSSGIPLPDIYLKVVSGKDPRTPPSSALIVGDLASIVVHFKDTGALAKLLR